MRQIGFLGLGAMGTAIATRFLSAGYDVLVWNRTASAADDLIAQGATLASSAQECLSLPLSFSMLANDAATIEILSAANIEQSPEPRTHVCMASISTTAADLVQEQLAALNVTYVSAPVLGRPNVAADGKLNILIAGSEEAVFEASPVLEHCSVKIWNFGDHPRNANAVKIAVNFTILHSLQAMAESIALVESQNVDANDFVELISSTMFPGPVFTGYGNIIANRSYDPPGFKMPLGLKDLGLAEALATEDNLTLPTLSTLKAVFEKALSDPQLAELDWSAIAEVTRQRNW